MKSYALEFAGPTGSTMFLLNCMRDVTTEQVAEGIRRLTGAWCIPVEQITFPGFPEDKPFPTAMPVRASVHWWGSEEDDWDLDIVVKLTLIEEETVV